MNTIIRSMDEYNLDRKRAQDYLDKKKLERFKKSELREKWAVLGLIALLMTVYTYFVRW